MDIRTCASDGPKDSCRRANHACVHGKGVLNFAKCYLFEMIPQVIDERDRNGQKVNTDDANDGRLVEDGTNKRRFALLDLLLDLKRRGVMSRTEVREQVDTFMFEVVIYFLLWHILRTLI